LFVVEVSITFTIASPGNCTRRAGEPNGRVVVMKPGDRLDLPAYTLYSAVVGPAGVVCLEARIPQLMA